MNDKIESLLSAIEESLNNGVILPFEIEQAYFNVVNSKE